MFGGGTGSNTPPEAAALLPYINPDPPTRSARLVSATLDWDCRIHESWLCSGRELDDWPRNPGPPRLYTGIGRDSTKSSGFRLSNVFGVFGQSRSKPVIQAAK